MFFVTGKQGYITCFHCGVAVKDWPEIDCPWQERTKWAPKYVYIIFIDGVQFVLDNTKF
jgi:hypothetical protein